MSKAHRGKGIRTMVNHGRGKCPVCGRDGVKLLYELELDGAKKTICKICKATHANKAAAKARKQAVAEAATPTVAATATE
jgi:hypothetical protein